MVVDVEFEEIVEQIDVDFGEIHGATDGGFEHGYAAGYADGLATRAYETWTFTLLDGTNIEKEVALL